MTIILKKGQHLDDLLPKGSSNKGAQRLNVKKYLGILDLNEVSVEIQKNARSEWE